MRTDSTQGSTYQREGSHSPVTTTNKVESFPGPMAAALQEHVSSSSTLSSSSSFLEAPNSEASSSSVVVARRRLTTTVTNEAQLTAALANNATIELGANILITSKVTIGVLTGVFIDGKGFEIDGNNAVQCFLIYGAAEVTLKDLIITRGSSGVSWRVKRYRLFLLFISFLSSSRPPTTLPSLSSHAPLF